jgi:hypothetical protein
MRYRPDGKLRPVADPEFSEDPIQVFLDGSFREMQLESDLLILLGFRDQVDNLLFPKTEFRIERLVSNRLRCPTVCAKSVCSLNTELVPASEAVAERVTGLEFKCGHGLVTLLFGFIGTITKNFRRAAYLCNRRSYSNFH